MDGWREDFSYAYYTRILHAIRSAFDCRLLGDAAAAIDPANSSRPILFLRHDIDLCLAAALRMARIEADCQTPATYMFLWNSPFYHLETEDSLLAVREIAALGHEVALHFDASDESIPAEASLDDAAPAIESACQRFEARLGFPVRSVSYHRPRPQWLRGALHVAGGRINAYAAPLLVRYISDSKGNWRAGEPIPKLAEFALECASSAKATSAGAPCVQVLTHPIWWGEQTESAEDRLGRFFLERTAGVTFAERARLRELLRGHLSVPLPRWLEAQFAA